MERASSHKNHQKDNVQKITLPRNRQKFPEKSLEFPIWNRQNMPRSWFVRALKWAINNSRSCLSKLAACSWVSAVKRFGTQKETPKPWCLNGFNGVSWYFTVLNVSEWFVTVLVQGLLHVFICSMGCSIKAKSKGTSPKSTFCLYNLTPNHSQSDVAQNWHGSGIWMANSFSALNISKVFRVGNKKTLWPIPVAAIISNLGCLW